MNTEQGHQWLAIMQSLKSVLDDYPPDPFWVNSPVVPAQLEDLCASFEKELTMTKQDLTLLFDGHDDTKIQTTIVADILNRWHMGEAPSLCAIAAFTCERYFPDMPEEFKSAIMISGVLGEVEHDLGYHNNMHFRKVLLSTLRLIMAHNEIYEGTRRSFDYKDIASLIIAACVHDLGHDGLGNTIRGVFYQGRLERRSFDLAKPYLIAAGFNDENLLADIKTMLLSTEVTPIDDPANAMNQMKAAYRFHYMGEKSCFLRLNLDEGLHRLEQSAELTMKALILHEADIATSAGLTYDITKLETSLHIMEVGGPEARPSHVVHFLDKICDRQFISDAGQKLYASNSSRIYALAQQDVEDGDVPFSITPKGENSLSFVHKTSESDVKTIN